MRRTSLALVPATCVAAVVALSAAQLPAPQLRDQFLVPVSGTWRAEIEDGVRVLTINGEAERTAPDAAAVQGLFGAAAPGVVAALAAPGAFPLAVARDVTNFPGGRLQVQFKLVAGATDQTAGIVFNLKPDGSYTYARYNTKDGNVAVWKFEHGARTVLQHGELHEQLAKNEWHTLEVRVAGAVVTATANGKLPVSHTLPGPVSGRVGLWTKTDSVTAVRRFTASH